VPGVKSRGQRREPLGKHSNVVSKRFAENLSVPAVLGEAGAKFMAQRSFEGIDAPTELLDRIGGFDIHGRGFDPTIVKEADAPQPRFSCNPTL
jgi:hypothetical protein